MKHAFLIIAHNELTILKKLLLMLDDERNDIYLHIDKKSNLPVEEISSLKLNKANLFIIDPIRVYWGDISQVKVEILLFEEAYKNGPYSYYHLLSGVDLPIKSQDYIHNFFNNNQDKEYVEFWSSSDHVRSLQKRTSRYFIFTEKAKSGGRFTHAYASFCRNVFLMFQKAIFYKRSHKLELRKGSNWVSITNNLCGIIIENKTQILKSLRFTFAPDEIFIQTILWNSSLKNNIYRSENGNSSIRAIDWERGMPYQWQNGDTEELLNSPYLFARKFSSTDMDIVDKIYNNFSEVNY